MPPRPFRRRWLMAGFIMGFSLTVLIGACDSMTRMPGKSYSGPLPAATPAEVELSHRLRRHVEMLGGAIGERNIWRPDALEAAARYIEATLEDMGYVTGRQEYEVRGQTVCNIEATLPGAAADREIIVVGAHYDSVRGAPGANDNATGVAAVLEIARDLRQAGAASGRSARLVFFVNEEPPFFQTEEMGSVVYARRCRQRGDKIAAMLTPETIGCYSDEPGSQHYPPPLGALYPSVGNFIAFVGDVGARDLVARCVASFRSHTDFPSEGAAMPAAVRGVGWSDHWSFSREGYPALMITDTAPFRYPHYHTANDTPDQIDYARMAKVVAGLTRVVQSLK